MQALEALASIARVSENVVRVLGQNPGKFTLQGTNTYIIGKHNPYILVDTGEGRDEYIPVLELALREIAPSLDQSEPDISDIIISHWHHDHVGGLRSVLTLLRRRWDERNTGLPYNPPRLHKFPISQPSPRDTTFSIIQSLQSGSFTPNPHGSILHDLHDGQIISGLQVLHTPGHTVDSICLYIPEDKALYTADTILGQGTAVFEDLGTYISSLNKMLQFIKDENRAFDHLYPGHGPVVAGGQKVIQEYVDHRQQRENEILSLLKSEGTNGAGATSTHWTTWSLVSKIYASYPESLWLPASHSVQLHLEKLEKEGVVRRGEGEGVQTVWICVR